MLDVAFEAWTKSREISALGTNAGAEILPFQNWRHFKEAFTPELVARAFYDSTIPVKRCLDPFGGSGTTALACQFLGIIPATIEVNPYLADLIEAKISSYDVDDLARDAGKVAALAARGNRGALSLLTNAPKTLVEPGVSGRWVFDRAVAKKIVALNSAISSLRNPRNRRLFRSILGGQLVDLSNVVISGKGRRYRRSWTERNVDPDSVVPIFAERLARATRDIVSYASRKALKYELYRGDARKLMSEISPVDLAVFSPPYPNSFDYTDVYNLELWMLGYLSSGYDNRTLRQSTFTSHVQLQRDYAPAPGESTALNGVLKSLRKRQNHLWHADIPSMVGGYFADLRSVLKSIRRKLSRGGRVYMVVGDSRYGGVTIPVGNILTELVPTLGFKIIGNEAFRSMRTSAQQGGLPQLPETLLVLL